MKKWLNNTIYPCKKIGHYPQIYIERVIVKFNRKGISIGLFEEKGGVGTSITMTK